MDFDQPKNIILGVIVLVVVLGGIIWAATRSAPTNTPTDQSNGYNQNETTTTPPSNNTNTQPTMNNDELKSGALKATIKTDKGNIVLELYPKAAPKTVENFVAKAKAKYFDGLKFHRVEDWVIQGGDPLSRDPAKQAMWGTGGGNIATELSSLPFVPGALGVARGGDIKISNDSQFFIVKTDAQFLNNQYTIFGQTVGGMDVVNKIAISDIIRQIVIE